MGNANIKRTKQEENCELEFAKLFVLIYLDCCENNMMTIFNYYHYLVSLQKNANENYFNKKYYYMTVKFYNVKNMKVKYYDVENIWWYRYNYVYYGHNLVSSNLVSSNFVSYHASEKDHAKNMLLMLEYLYKITFKYQKEPCANYEIKLEINHDLQMPCYETNKIVKNVCEEKILELKKTIIVN